MKDGLLFEDGVLVYYKNGKLFHAGVIKHDGDIYYIDSHGQAVKGRHAVHRGMSNGLLKRGVYTFGDDCKLIPGSYVAPEKKKKKLKDTTKKKLLKLASLAVVLVLIVVCIKFIDGKTTRKPATPDTTVPSATNPSTTEPSTTDPDTTVPSATDPVATAPNTSLTNIVLPSFTEEVLLCSKAAKQLYDGEISALEAVEYGNPYQPFVFKYQLINTDGILLLSENKDISNAKEYRLDHNKTALSIDNLKTGTTYYYEVQVENDSYFGSFTTAKSTRFISIPGASNVRDIGGYTTQDGKTVKQGMVIRGSEIDGLVTKKRFVSDEDLAIAQETFGFKYDFDLRGSSIFLGNYITRFGEDVKHHFFCAPQYGEVFYPEFSYRIREVFTALADPNNYPMYVHCSYGSDRTGTIIFLLQGVLNISEEEMIREFQRCGYESAAYASSHEMYVIIAGLHQYEGETLQEKIVSFLTTDIGVTEAEIEAVRRNLLTD